MTIVPAGRAAPYLGESPWHFWPCCCSASRPRPRCLRPISRRSRHPGDRPARRQRLLRGDDGRRRRRRQARRRRRDRGRRRLVRQPDWKKHDDHQGRHRARQRLHPAARHRRRRPGRLRPRGRLAADQHARPAARSSGSGDGRRRRRALAGPPDRLRSRPSTGSAGATCWAPARSSSSSRPLQGRGTKGPDWGDGQRRPRPGLHRPRRPGRRPLAGRGRRRLAAHDPQPPAASTSTATARDEIVLAAWEGVFVLDRDPGGRWSKTQLGAGNQEAKPFKGSSEVKVGRLADGRRYIATIEPWHGFQVVVYTPPAVGHGASGTASVIDEPVPVGPRRLVRRPRRRRRRGADHRPARQEQGPGPRARRARRLRLRPDARARPPWSSPATSSTTAASPPRTSSPPTSTATAGRHRRRRPPDAQRQDLLEPGARASSLVVDASGRRVDPEHQDAMKAVVITQTGGPEALEVREVPTPEPQGDQVRGPGAGLRAEPGRPDAGRGAATPRPGGAGRHPGPGVRRRGRGARART